MRIAQGLLAPWIMAGCVVGLAACSKDEAEEPASEPAADGDKAAEPPAEEGEPAVAEETPAAEPIPVAEPAPAAEPTGFDGAAASKYVTSFALNVRTGPGKEFPVKRHVKRGDKVDVVINGEWGKLASGEYVSVNRLSDQDPAAKPAGKAKKKKK